MHVHELVKRKLLIRKKQQSNNPIKRTTGNGSARSGQKWQKFYDSEWVSKV